MNTTDYPWNDMPVTLVGMGRSSVGAATLLQRHGARPFVTDMADTPQQRPWMEALDREGVPYEIGQHTARAWERPALVVLSPGVPPTIAPVQLLRAQGVEIIGELELAARFTKVPIVAVTGTNGKTTVTELLHHLIGACGFRSCLAGNNHTSFSAALCAEETPDYFVLEVSSYQLESVATFTPWIASVLNVTPDHLGRHGTMEAYANTKARIFGSDAHPVSVAVCNGDDARVDAMVLPAGVPAATFSTCAPVSTGLYSDGTQLWVDGTPTYPFDSPLPGRHNRANVLAALTMMHVGGFALDRCLAALKTFPGVEHRLESLGESGGRCWYNDSKSTNVDSLRVALESFTGGITLIAGGQGKGSSYESLRPLVKERVGHLLAFGAEAPVLQAAFRDLVRVTVVDVLDQAVRIAHGESTPGATIVLSPGCASFDQYPNFEARGAHFKALVGALKEEVTLS